MDGCRTALTLAALTLVVLATRALPDAFVVPVTFAVTLAAIFDICHHAPRRAAVLLRRGIIAISPCKSMRRRWRRGPQ